MQTPNTTFLNLNFRSIISPDGSYTITGYGRRKTLSVTEAKISFEPISGSVVVDPQAGEISMKVILNPLNLLEEISNPMKALYNVKDVREATVLSKM